MTRCPDCNYPNAYVGLVKIECQNPQCRHYMTKVSYDEAATNPIVEPPKVQTYQPHALVPYRAASRQLKRNEGKSLQDTYQGGFIPPIGDVVEKKPFQCGLCQGPAESESLPCNTCLRKAIYGSIKNVTAKDDHRQVLKEALLEDGFQPGDVAFDQVWIPDNPCPTSQYVFFRDLVGKGRRNVIGGSHPFPEPPGLMTNMDLQSRLNHGKEAVVTSVRVRLSDRDGHPLKGADLGWAKNNLTVLHEVNRLKIVEGFAWQLVEGTDIKPKVVTSDYEIHGDAIVVRPGKGFGGAIVGLHLEGYVRQSWDWGQRSWDCSCGLRHAERGGRRCPLELPSPQRTLHWPDYGTNPDYPREPKVYVR